jgi:integrase
MGDNNSTTLAGANSFRVHSFVPAVRHFAARRAGFSQRRSGHGQRLSNIPRATFNHLVEAYQGSPEWNDLAASTREEWGRHLKRIQASWGNLEVKGVEPKHVLALRDAHAETPASANNLVRTLSSLLAWSVPRGWRRDNPCREIQKLKIGTGYEPWPWDAIEHFATHARKDLWHAGALALFSGQRLSDVLKVKWSDMADGLISVRQGKTGKSLWIPVHRRLASILIEVPRASVFVLTNSRRRPWTVDGFKAAWSDELNRPVMATLRKRRLVFHGLRNTPDRKGRLVWPSSDSQRPALVIPSS